MRWSSATQGASRRVASSAPMDEEIRGLMRSKAADVRSLALAELDRRRGGIKLRKLARTVLAQVVSPRDRGAGSLRSLAMKEPAMLEAFVKVLKRSRVICVKNGEASIICAASSRRGRARSKIGKRRRRKQI